MSRRQYVFAQFLNLLPRYDFQRIVNKYNGDYRTKQFKCWNQMACMILAHIRQEDSLRDIDITLNAHADKLYHMGIQQCPKSTLADANEHRNYRIYEELAKLLMQRARRRVHWNRFSSRCRQCCVCLGRVHHRPDIISISLGKIPKNQRRHQIAHYD